jgi:nitroimidazol reductase NimA-like FMN-containing flavoprotein (pyridoxamine 5'-phosphate oxidase superfamily)
MTHTATPTIQALSAAECAAVLTRNRIGRLAYSFHDRVDIEPIHYVFAEGSLYFRTAPGSKATTLAHHPWVAFEVDEADELLAWRSVVVHGTVYRAIPDGAAADKEAYDRAVRHLRAITPELFTDDDPVPLRSLIMVMHPDKITGRTARVSDSPAPGGLAR